MQAKGKRKEKKDPPIIIISLILQPSNEQLPHKENQTLICSVPEHHSTYWIVGRQDIVVNDST